MSLFHFGYFNQNSLLFTTEPSLDALEERLKRLIRKPFIELEAIEKVLDNERFHYKTEAENVRNLSKTVDNLLTLSFYEPYALLMVFFLYEFYYLQKKTLITDIINDFQVLPPLFLIK